MKIIKQLLILVTVLFSNTVYSQTVNGVPLKEMNQEYVLIVGQGKFLSNKLNIKLDFGQKVNFWGTEKELNLLDENGKKVELNSMVDALNFMSGFGYDFVNAYVVTVSGTQNVYHWLLKKKKSETEPVIEEVKETEPVIEEVQEAEKIKKIKTVRRS